MAEIENEGEKLRGAIFRDIRRYYCDYCGICRSKKSLIASHMLTHHEEQMKEKEKEKGKEKEQKQSEEDEPGKKLNVCEECGASFRKPAHLKQHMQSHSLERPFKCPVDDCQSSYRRKDHLTRHMLQHQGKLFECPVADCKIRFTLQGNIARHVKQFHDESASADSKHPKERVCAELHDESASADGKHPEERVCAELHDESAAADGKHLKECVCAEHGCGKVFKYPSQLRKHEDSHIKLDSVEAFCIEPSCMKYFTNEQCLKEHIRSCHRYITCDKCGMKQLKKNIKRHIRKHEGQVSSERIKCSFPGCLQTFSTTSNLNQHTKAVHFQHKPFACSRPGCHMKFAFKHVRDHHEISGCHVFTPGDFEESDEQFRSRPRGGQKRKCPFIETLSRKRVVPPSESDLSKNVEHDYPSWLSSAESQN